MKYKTKNKSENGTSLENKTSSKSWYLKRPIASKSKVWFYLSIPSLSSHRRKNGSMNGRVPKPVPWYKTSRRDKKSFFLLSDSSGWNASCHTVPFDLFKLKWTRSINSKFALIHDGACTYANSHICYAWNCNVQYYQHFNGNSSSLHYSPNNLSTTIKISQRFYSCALPKSSQLIWKLGFLPITLLFFTVLEITELNGWNQTKIAV